MQEKMLDYSMNADTSMNPNHAVNYQGGPDNFFNFPGDFNSSRQNAFVMNSPPLAALHNMTEMKTSAVASCAIPNGPYAYPKNCMANGTPHGITDILSRPELHPSSLTSYNSSRLPNATPNYYSPTTTNGNLSPRAISKPISELPPRPLYWPGNVIPSTSPSWNKHPPPRKSGEEDSKSKKNTRPTFTGEQIFALEKTFEQTKYLAGPERARLAYGLGMSESQVKVWFQNRRTKWRKKHAADMVQEKQRQSLKSSSDTSEPREEQSPVGAYSDTPYKF